MYQGDRGSIPGKFFIDMAIEAEASGLYFTFPFGFFSLGEKASFLLYGGDLIWRLMNGTVSETWRLFLYCSGEIGG